MGSPHKPLVPSTWVEEQEQEFKIILGHIVSSRPAWTPGGSVLKIRKLEREGRSKERQATRESGGMVFGFVVIGGSEEGREEGRKDVGKGGREFRGGEILERRLSCASGKRPRR